MYTQNKELKNTYNLVGVMTFSLMLIKYSGPSTGLEKHVKYSTVTYDMSYDDAIDQFIKTTMEMEGKIT